MDLIQAFIPSADLFSSDYLFIFLKNANLKFLHCFHVRVLLTACGFYTLISGSYSNEDIMLSAHLHFLSAEGFFFCLFFTSV